MIFFLREGEDEDEAEEGGERKEGEMEGLLPLPPRCRSHYFHLSLHSCTAASDRTTGSLKNQEVGSELTIETFQMS